MELTLNTKIATSEPEPSGFVYKSSYGLLNSNYKDIVQDTYNKPLNDQLFGQRQKVKYHQFYNISHPAVILRLVFFITLLSILL